MGEIALDLVNIFNSIVDCKLKYCHGPYGVSALLKFCVCTFSKLLCCLFNMSLKTCKFINYWKYSFINPIHKIGDKNDIANYIGNSIQSEISKLLDYLVSTLSVYTDFSEAFDRIKYTLLLEKLRCVGFGNAMLQWFGSFFCERL